MRTHCRCSTIHKIPVTIDGAYLETGWRKAQATRGEKSVSMEKAPDTRMEGTHRNSQASHTPLPWAVSRTYTDIMRAVVAMMAAVAATALSMGPQNAAPFLQIQIMWVYCECFLARWFPCLPLFVPHSDSDPTLSFSLHTKTGRNENLQVKRKFADFLISLYSGLTVQLNLTRTKPTGRAKILSWNLLSRNSLFCCHGICYQEIR